MKLYPSYKASGVPWLGNVPSPWGRKRLRDCVEGCANGVWGDDPQGDSNDIPVIRVADFDRERRRVREYETIRNVEPSQRHGRALLSGDMLIEKSGGGEQQPVGMVVTYQGPDGAVCSNFVARMAPRDGIVSRFMVYLHAHLYASRVTNLSVKQTTGIQNLDSMAYLSEQCFVPTEGEQKAIAAYLDIETARIGELIQEKEGLIQVLIEARSSVFATIFARHAEVPSSGWSRVFPWLPCVPASWPATKVKYLTVSMDQGISPQCEAHPPEEGEWGVLKVGCVNTGDFDPSESKALPIDIEPIQDITLKEHDVVVSRANTKNLVGRAAMVDRDYPRLMLSDKLYRIRLDMTRCEPAFLVYLLAHPWVRSRIEERATGASASMLNIDRRTILDLELPLPPRSVQCLVIDEVKAERDSFATLITHTQDEIVLLKELRAATIADAVLGRIDVRTLGMSQT